MKKYRFSYNFRGNLKVNGADFALLGQTIIESISKPDDKKIRDHLQTIVTEQLNENYELDEFHTIKYKFLREES